MKAEFNRFFLLYATTALCTAAWSGTAFGQTAPPTETLDLGSVTATAGSTATVAPSATGTQAQAIRQQKLAPNIISVQPASVMR
ncbi:MAG: hypothetical protein KGH75_11125, partial [Rhodospirillales bacterium]|nr:hypothetical protein [Rhodospirillales bacterium]